MAQMRQLRADKFAGEKTATSLIGLPRTSPLPPLQERRDCIILTRDHVLLPHMELLTGRHVSSQQGWRRSSSRRGSSATPRLTYKGAGRSAGYRLGGSFDIMRETPLPFMQCHHRKDFPPQSCLMDQRPRHWRQAPSGTTMNR